MPRPLFSDVVRVASSMPDSKGRRDLARILRSAKLEWDEEQRKVLMDNEDGFLISGLMGKKVSLHLNRNKNPYFNLKPPKAKGQYSSFGKTIGNVYAAFLTNVHFHVGRADTINVCLKGKRRDPYAGPVGNLEGVEFGPDFPGGMFGEAFGEVPRKGQVPLTFNPHDNRGIDIGGEYPIVTMRGLFFCIDGGKRNTPISTASSVVCREWGKGKPSSGTWANSPKVMSDSEQQHFIDAVEKAFGRPFGILDRPGQPDERVASFTQKKGIIPRREGYNDDPRFWNVHSSLVRVAYCHPETRKYLLPLLAE